MNKILLSFLLLAFSISTYAQKIVGYIPNYRTTSWMDQHIEWGKMTDAYYFGARVGNGQGTAITIEHSDRFQHVRTKASQNNLDLWLSIGGWGKSENFSTVAGNVNARIAFANKMIELCQTYNLKGVDLDWEFPQSYDKTNYKLLLKAISDAFDADGSGYLISVAVGAEQGHANNWDAGSFQYIDHLNIMSYDDPHLTDGNHASLKFMKKAMDIYHTAGCPYNKMLGGVAFYSRCSSVQMFNQFASASTFNADLSGGKCYNGKQTCEDKIDWVMTKGGVGVLIWEVTQDVKGQYSLLNVLHTKAQTYGTPCTINEPNFSTASISICGKNSVMLDPNVSAQSGVSYSWKKDGQLINGATNIIYAATTQGAYEFMASNSECSQKATITVSGSLTPVTLGADVKLCETSSIILKDDNADGTIKWYKNGVVLNGSTAKQIEISEVGTYKIEVSATSCTPVSDEVVVTSGLVTANDIQICKNNSGTLEVNETVNGNVSWFASYDATDALGTGTMFNVSPSVTTHYYVAQGNGTSSSCAGIDEWSASKEYKVPGTEVVYNGNLYSSVDWWTVNNNPETTPTEWQLEEACGGTSCIKTSVKVTVDPCLANEEVMGENNTMVYPNPASDIIIVENANTIQEIEVLSVSGQLLTATNNSRVDVSTLTNGNYILKVTTTEGVEFTKFVKK